MTHASESPNREQETHKTGESSLLSPRTRVTRVPKRGHYDHETLYRICDEALICHVGFVFEGKAAVIPTIHWREGNRLYIHGATKSRMLQALARGGEACISITLLDGLVLARSAFHHSMNYRSVVIYAKGQVVEDADTRHRVLMHFVDHVFPGRGQEVRPPNAAELKATQVIGFSIEEGSSKIRVGGPIDDEEDHALPVWAGVIPLTLQAGEPIAADGLAPGIAVPEYARNYSRAGGQIVSS
ncbi:Pyridoxamine 5'-phosphate oxidase family protein [Sulfidibacter corallicola]|uniref:Pyridoxamine 5'-phosphate oxidase family protein n=1 Tax=Sulfidibacter corallicola TaxID=2818388 RepID=A0A8A4TVE2_SULCO|nr:pyridoxamine 5'-phosphate oxidase family protein [Sulfidibacter corallicola]QTD53453.1 pyridoxamine 5'-phosphate oxidase family protein [Sulfidibacter corallicola]